MGTADILKGLIFKKPARSEAENPYLAACRTWNDHVGAVVAQRQTWQMIGILALLVALASVGGVIHIGRQSKFIPYVVQVDKLGQTMAAGPVQATDRADPRVVHAAVADWMGCARMVTPDMALQRKCVFKVYSMLAPNDPATPKMNEWLNGSADASPFKRAEKEMASIEIKTVIPQTPNTWEIEWMETTRSRQGMLTGPPVAWRALVTTYIAEVTASTTDVQLRNNPLGIYVSDYSWSRVQ
ncbi:conjugal transfer protein TrbF [Verminephrobacter aporrectodeae subsp. tuberculatae]|uniref:Conjugal transfer protein TrbF n=1 Tax=Verminephrobacter aporrectodeae subsp. tuberculatae TaxID=1110392 RepID=A0ABT3KU95_9BURK|nr:conjugal transfer protein TrbF [Verminephrobacter aporrectodeae]MCW5222897.1 conjugal transfer protein TrbF [Verminephrobacter aporrectodeae subsp. tuberculatae]MCW5256885.1 conjugal transfer protein TrbF [Verminephrobacter aporrectodeae subsp. tuberculatae]MCW5288361.1 conjugal transfer protein TrbF [Verminephrobacter aporrectodeae subsp. tuberculatae]MCW5321903.1 conjugal transfer protein TrbF [Verminephrobacter aporrectodeae subsp. tuberculatae]MCW8166493.1 conjugal transfer protein TrbF